MKSSFGALRSFLAGLLVLSSVGGATAGEAEVQELLQERMPHLKISTVSPSPMAGIYEVVFDGFRVVYVSENAEYVLDGSLMELSTGRNITRERGDELQVARYDEMGKKWVKTLRDFGADQLLSYEGSADGTLAGREMFVFTDITCPYCARFHQQIGELTGAGITVHYVLFARAGLNSQPHQQHISIWCNADPQQALSDGKAGKAVEPAQCEHPIDEHMELVKQVEVNATPTIILDSGERVDGFRQARDFIAMVTAKPALAAE